jgi:hypothetical protein
LKERQAGATRHTPHATRHAPRATRHMPHATRHTPHATCHAPRATRHTPHATRHMPRATRHTPRATRHGSAGLLAGPWTTHTVSIPKRPSMQELAATRWTLALGDIGEMCLAGSAQCSASGTSWTGREHREGGAMGVPGAGQRPARPGLVRRHWGFNHRATYPGPWQEM